MNKRFSYTVVAISVLFLVGIGLIVDRVGGLSIRSNDVSSSIVLSFSQPLIKGVPLAIRWQGHEQENVGVEMRLVAQSETVSLGSAKLLAGAMRITVPCGLPDSAARLELIDATSRAILATNPVDILPAGPDCVR